MFSLLFLLILTLLVSLTVREKAHSYTSRKVPDEVKTSPFAKALSDLVATAGGIYLSLVMLISFLQLSVPTEVSFWGVNFEPLAGISLVITLMQPWIMKLLNRGI